MQFFKNLKYISISTRISILLGVIIILTMSAFSIFSLIKQKKDAVSSISRNTDQLSQTIEKILRISMLKNRRDDISLAVNNIIGSEGIRSVRILNHKGIIKFSSRQFEIESKILQTNQLCTSCHKNAAGKLNIDIKKINQYRIDNENNVIYNSLPIYNAPGCYNGVCHSTPRPSGLSNPGKTKIDSVSLSPHHSSQTILGFIEIEVSIKKVIADLEKTEQQLLILTVLFALIASMITYFSIRYFIGKPVKNLVDGTLRVAQGDFKNEIPPGKAELRLLSESFNKMQKQLLATQNQLIESEKSASIGKLAEEIANEINNPLTGIIIYSESLIERSYDGETKEDYVTILQEALKIRENIRNILSLTSQQKPSYCSINIEEIIKHAVSTVRKFSNFRNIQIITNAAKPLPDISADPGLLEQVFLNLLLISSELMSSGGILNISVIYTNENLETTFTDTGKPISESTIAQIFNQDNTSSLESFDKIGISIAVCKDIIEMHKGEIFINSTGTGNSITIKLPV